MSRVNGPTHPGEILREEYLGPLDLSQSKLAKCIRVDAGRINQIVNEERGITVDTALRLAAFFDTTPRFWMNLQMKYDLQVAQDQEGDSIREDVVPLSELET